MRKSELLAIKVREYERGVSDTRKKFRIDKKDVEDWADEAWSRVHNNQDASYIEDTMRDMLIEIGVEIVSSQQLDKSGR